MTAWLPSWCSETFLPCFSAPKYKLEQIKKNCSFTSLFKSLIFLAFWFFLQPVAVSANNISISNQALVGQDSSATTIKVQFDISWSNSWRDSTNYDAAWVFFKYSTDSGSTWNHATLKTSGTNPTNFSAGSGTKIDIVVPTDKKGCFIQRSSLGSGALSTTSVQVVWDYGQDGVSDSAASNSSAQVKVIAIEMVYVSQGGFYLGDTTAGTNGEFQWESSVAGTVENEADLLSFEAAVGTANAWYYTSDTGGTDDAASGAIFTVSSSFPKGYAAFYCMKYEITEGQWVDFFNTLTTAQKTNRDITDATGKNSDAVVNRNTIAWTTGDATTSKTDRACSYLSWMDIAAYADWAGLRPMSELEFEKAGRGPLYPVAGEYAWGSTSITAAVTISGTEAGTETITTANANAAYNNTTFLGTGDGGTGPLRAGIFATSSTTTRVTSGASYYGIMELSGNVWERAVSIGTTTGRGFSGTHGDGILTATSSYEGNATNLDWPGVDTTSAARGITGAAGSGLRGGGWATTTAGRLAVSNRWKAGTTDTTRGTDYGGRCVRTAP